jgi:tRNA G18 (ribose-2'-O)-methylase SpoU
MIRIDSLDDERIQPYRNLKDRELAAMGGLFLAEGEHVTRRLMASRTHQTHSVLLAEHRVESIAPAVPLGVPIYVGSREMVSQIVGYTFHSGVLSVGIRPANPSLESIFENEPAGGRTTLLICPEVINHDNLGSLIRIAAGFGVSAMLVGERSCDPYWRRSVRVSMGTIFSLPVITSRHLSSDLELLQKKWGVHTIATVLDAEAIPLQRSLRKQMPNGGRRIGILLGSESQGLDRWTIDHCDTKVTIPMFHGTDSLNIAVAAGVFLYHYTCQD